MLIVRSPLRISLAGGGTDLPAYYREHGGVVVNTAIDRYFYVFLKTTPYNGLEIASSDFRIFFRHIGEYPLSWEGELELPRAIFKHFGVTRGVRLFIASEIPPGTGLGSSSSVAVGLIKALVAACGLSWTSQQIAELASYIEIEMMHSPIGKQDQYAAALGGLNLVEFAEETTRVTPLELSLEHKRALECSLMLFYTGQSRSANSILARQKKASESKNTKTIEALHKVKAMVPMVMDCLQNGDIEGFGQLLHKNWLEKKRFTTGMSNRLIDECYEAAMRAGAYGGKIAGAGGGGFLLICCGQSDRVRITEELEKRGLIRVGFHFDDIGATIVMNSGLLLTSRFHWERPKELQRLVS